MKTNNKLGYRKWTLIWGLGMAGQISWNIENQWFNTFVYEEIAPNSSIIMWMVVISALMTTFSAFLFGTLSDRIGKRKPFIVSGYVLWGIFTILYGFTMFVPKTVSGSIMFVAVILVMADAIMSFFGSMGFDSGFHPWITDMLNNENRGSLGATLATLPVLGSIVGTVIGGIIIASFGYIWFFTAMGIVVIIIGVLSIFTVKESPTLEARKSGTFFQQFISSFMFKEFFDIKELVWVNTMVTIFFIGCNVYFVHLGNLFIYNYGFKEDAVGIIQGVGLIVAVLFTIPGKKLVNNDKFTLLIIISVVINIIGLILMYLLGSSSDSSGIFIISNIPLFLGITFMGIGYILFFQAVVIWTKQLYPSGSRGRFEGIRVVFFVLIPMLIGPMIANPIIKIYGKSFTKEYATGVITGQVPTELLFLVAAIIILFSLIPLVKATKYHNNRIK